MSKDARAFAAAAHALVGSPFRLRGRDPVSGIDCVGLVACALRAIGRDPPVLPHYTLRNLEPSAFLELVRDAGFSEARSLLSQGDLILLKPSPGQFHLAVIDDRATMIHAHAGLGRVVVSPRPDPLLLTGHWRLT